MNRGFVPPRTETGRRWLSAVLVSLVAAGVTLVGTTAKAAPADITFSRISGVLGSDLQVARTAADNPVDPPTFQVKADVFLDNSGPADRDVTSVRFSYPGSGLAPFQYTPTVFPPGADGTAETGADCGNAADDDGDEVADDGCPPRPFAIPAGDEGRVPVYDGLDRDLPTPLPSSVRIELFIDGDPGPLQLDFGLAFRDNPVANGAYFFPGKASDLAPGQYWAFGTRHVVDSGGGGATLNPSGRTQRHALDMDVVAYDSSASAWLSTKPGTTGDTNDDYWGFGLPMYAMADGVITGCYRGEADHQPGGFDQISFEFLSGNTLFIEHGGDLATYAHMQDGSIPTDLCPADGENNGLSIPVAAGQFLGRMGNTGRSTATHLHLQTEHLPDADFVEGAPIHFLNIRALSDETTVNNLGSAPTLRPLHNLALHRHSLILPNPCGLDDLPAAGLTEVSRHGIPAECYQDVFQQITARGYRPQFVDGYDVGGQTFFNAAFRPAGGAWVARHGLDGTQYQDLYDELTDEGWRLQQVDSYLDGGNVRYAAIFEPRAGPLFAAFHGLADADYDDQVETLKDQGYVAVNISAVEIGGQRFWTGLFEQVAAASWTVETVPVSEYQSTYDDNAAAGLVPIYVHGFSGVGGPYLTGIWVAPVGGSTAAVHGLPSTDYQSASVANLAANRLTRAVTGYQHAGSAAFAAVWRVAPNTLITSTPPAETNSSTAIFGFGADNPFTTFECRVDVVAYTACDSPKAFLGVDPGHHTFSVRAVDRETVRDPTPASFTWHVTIPTKTTLSSSGNPSVFGQAVAFTATVAPVPPGSGTPSGTVQFKIDGVNFGAPVALVGGSASSGSTTALAVGPHTITAVYGGGGDFDPSMSLPLVQTVNKAASTVAITSSANPIGLFGSATFTASVVAVPPGAGPLTGTVQFKRGATNLGPPVTLNASGQAQRTVSGFSLGLGTHPIIAVYSGDANFTGSTSPVVAQKVTAICTLGICLP